MMIYAHDNCIETSEDDTAQESYKPHYTDKESDSKHNNQQITKSEAETHCPSSESISYLPYCSAALY